MKYKVTLNKRTYEVENHVVADAFTSNTETPDGRADQGNNVIIVLKNTLYLDNTNTSAKSTTATDTAKNETRDEQQHAIPTITAGSKPERKNNPYPTTVVFRQTAPVKTTDGKTYTERLLLRNTMAATLVVDDFKQMVYHDSKTGDSLRYNIFVPSTKTGAAQRCAGYPRPERGHDPEGDRPQRDRLRGLRRYRRTPGRPGPYLPDEERRLREASA